MEKIELKQFEALIKDETNTLAMLCNATAFLKQITPDINWLGFYFFKNRELVLGPFQGKVACSHLNLNQGVCAKCFNDNYYLYVPDVHDFSGHIACDSASNSELVIPLNVNHQEIGVLDIDSPIIERFKDEDIRFFLQIVEILENVLNKKNISK